MSYYQMNTDVYIVGGKKMSAIYDLNKGFLYSINQYTKNLIDHIVSNKIKHLSAIEKEACEFLLKNNLLIVSENKHEKKSIKELKISYPWQFSWIEVTRKCNLSCIFCYEMSDYSCQENMSFESLKFAVSNLLAAKISKIQFIGGEPLLLNGTLQEMISYCKNKFAFIEVYTNGTLIDEKWCKFFKENDINVALSIHSYIPEEHDRVVNCKGAHRLVSKATNLLDEYNIKYRIATIKNKSCIIGEPTDENTYKLCPKGPKVTGRSQLSQYNYEMFLNKIITKNTFQQQLNKKSVQIAVSGTRCFLKNIYIATDLTVYPCVMERRYNYGNLAQKPLTEMMHDEFRLSNKDSIEGCRECEYRYACFSCRPDANGKGLYEKPWYCSYNPETGVWQEPRDMFNSLLKVRT